MSIGPASWTSFPFRHEGVWLDGTQIESGYAYPLTNLSVVSGSRMLTSVGGTEIVQRRWLASKAPVNVRSIPIRLQMNVKDEADYRLFLLHGQRGVAVEFFPDWPWIEEWYIPAMTAGQTTWEPARKFPWDLAGIDHSTRPPRVYKDDVSQTIVTTGTPGAGEAKVPIVGGFDVVTTPSGITGTWLRLEYAPVFTVLINEVGMAYEQHNRLVFEVNAVEQMARRFT